MYYLLHAGADLSDTLMDRMVIVQSMISFLKSCGKTSACHHSLARPDTLQAQNLTECQNNYTKLSLSSKYLVLSSSPLRYKNNKYIQVH